MRIKDIHLSNFRNHSNTYLKFSGKLNIIRGLNGSGKTSILEAISVTSLSKTFLPTSDSGLIKSGDEGFIVKVNSSSDVEVDYRISVEYKSGTRKKINSSYGDNLNPKDIIGIIPVIILSPDYKSLTFGSPSDRRQFLDTILSQSSRKYVDDSLKYKKLLKQRNAMLSQNLKSGNLNRSYFELLTDEFIKCSTDILERRIKFLNEFIPFFISSYRYVADNNEIPDIIYEPDSIKISDFNAEKSIELQYRESYFKKSTSELRRGITQFGIHRDELVFTVNGLKAKECASQGQHKTLLIAIKLAEFEYLKKVLNETPVILFDDIFSELDIERSNAVFSKILNSDAQTIITMTNSERLIEEFHSYANYFDINNGKVTENYV